jgi:hypothetical protein
MVLSNTSAVTKPVADAASRSVVPNAGAPASSWPSSSARRQSSGGTVAAIGTSRTVGVFRVAAAASDRSTSRVLARAAKHVQVVEVQLAGLSRQRRVEVM